MSRAGIGETRTALRISALAVLVNVLLNGPCIARYGVKGAAYATNVAAALAAAVGLCALARGGGVDVFPLPRRPDWRVLRRITYVGAPVGTSGALFTVAYVLLGRTLSALSSTALAALAVGHRAGIG